MSKTILNILTPIPFWHAGTHELIEGLRNNGFEVVALDIWDFKYYNQNGVTEYLIPTWIKGFARKVYKKLNRKRIIKKYINNDQIVDIQWCGHYYSAYMGEIKANSKKVYATLYGSEFYRSTQVRHKIQRKIFDLADYIVLGPNMDNDFTQVFPGLEKKYLFTQYGSKRLDKIGNFPVEKERKGIRLKYGISESEIVITVGYNSKPEQQHLVMLNCLRRLDNELKDKIILVFPLTYGVKKTDEYFQKLLREIQGSDFRSLIFQERLSDEELIETKIISDITVNFQTTDALSSSIKEAFAAKNIVVVGDWLPYEIYENLGIFFYRTSIENALNTLSLVLNNLDENKKALSSNQEKVLAFASWDVLINQYIFNYKL